MRVPVLKEERYYSTPLAGGSAEPYDPSSEPPPNIVQRINGQVLIGNMIPQRHNHVKKFRAHQKLLESHVPAVISYNNLADTKNEMEPLLERDPELGYGAVETSTGEKRLIKDLAFDSAL